MPELHWTSKLNFFARLEIDDLPDLPAEGVTAEQDVELLSVLIGDEGVGVYGGS